MVKVSDYKYRVQRHEDTIFAEVYYIQNDNERFEIHVVSKKFNEFFREPNEKTYERANNWADGVCRLEAAYGKH